MTGFGRFPVSLILILILIPLLLIGCVTGTGEMPTRGTDLRTDAELPTSEPTAIEFKALGAGAALPGDKEEALGSISMYLLSRLTESPYFKVVLSDQERVLTGSVGLVDGRYLLSLYTVNYKTSEVESSVSVDFLSLKEFDYAVDIAVAELEGREIRPAESINFPELAFSGLELSSLTISTEIPRTEAATSDDELRRMDGMLREILEQGDYHLKEGRFREAAEVYEDFLTRFDQGITGSYASRLGGIRDYARTQLEQARVFLSLAEYEDELENIEESYSAGQIRAAYRTISRLSNRISLEREQAPEVFDRILERVRENQINLYTHVVRDNLGQVEEMVRTEEYNRAYFRLKGIRMEIEENGFQNDIPDIYRAVLQGEKELENTCRNLLEARSSGFIFNIGYYGFSDDKEGLRKSFLDFRSFLAGSPFVYSTAPLFNDRLSYYGSRYGLTGIDPINSPAVTSVFPAGSAVRVHFYDAEEQISLLHLFGTPFMKVLSDAGYDPLASYRMIKAMLPDMDRQELLREVLKEKPDLFYGNDRLSEIGELYRSYIDKGSIEWRDSPNLLNWIIDRKGHPLYFYNEEFDAGDNRSFRILTIIRRAGDAYRIETVDQADSEGEYLEPLLFPIDITNDRENNTAICYVKGKSLLVSLFSETGRKDYPGIKFLNLGLFWKLTGEYKQRFVIRSFQVDSEGSPVIFYTDKKGLSVFGIKNGSWVSSSIEKDGGFAFLAADQNAYLVNSMDRMLFFRHLDGVSSLLLLTRTEGAWQTEELPAFTELSATLYESDPHYYFLNDRGFEQSIMVRNQTKRGNEPLYAALLTEEGRWRAGQWIF